jgi:hypothetical protein
MPWGDGAPPAYGGGARSPMSCVAPSRRAGQAMRRYRPTPSSASVTRAAATRARSLAWRSSMRRRSRRRPDHRRRLQRLCPRRPGHAPADGIRRRHRPATRRHHRPPRPRPRRHAAARRPQLVPARLASLAPRPPHRGRRAPARDRPSADARRKPVAMAHLPPGRHTAGEIENGSRGGRPMRRVKR